VYRHLPGVVDLAGPRGDGSFLVAAAGRLLVLGRGGTLRMSARPLTLGDSELMAQHQDLGVLPPRLPP
jgi:hypothetical protein